MQPEMIDVEEYAVGDGAAQRSESLVQALDSAGEAAGQIRVSHVAEGGLVRNDAALKEDSRGTVGAEGFEQLRRCIRETESSISPVRLLRRCRLCSEGPAIGPRCLRWSSTMSTTSGLNFDEHTVKIEEALRRRSPLSSHLKVETVVG